MVPPTFPPSQLSVIVLHYTMIRTIPYLSDGCPNVLIRYASPKDSPPSGIHSNGKIKVKDDESSFVYGDYKLLVEMEADMHWIWEARRSLQGTTVNRVAGERPKYWKTWAKKHPDAAQWTRVNVISHQVAMAGRRDNRD